MAERALATAFVNIVPGTKDLELWMKKGLPNAADGSGAMAGKRFGGAMSNGFRSMLGPLTAALSVVGIASLTGDMIRAAENGTKVDATLSNITKSMGLFGGKTTDVVGRLQDFATAQMKLTGVDDDVIKGAQAKLMTFSAVGKSANVMGGAFDQATKLAMDLSAAGFGSVDSASVMLGKALQNPVQGVTALQRVGVSLTAAQKQQVANFMKVNDVASAQKVILAEVSRQVGGTAEASATPLAKMKAQWDDLTQAIGTDLMPVMNSIASFIVTDVIPAVEGTVQGFKDFFGFVGANMNWIGPLTLGLAAVALGVSAVGLSMSIAAAGGLSAYLTAMFPAIASTWAFTVALLSNPITWIVVGIIALITAIVLLAMNWDAVVKFISDVWNGFISWITDVINGFASWWGGVWDGMIGFFTDLFNGIGSFISDIFKGVMNNIIDALNWGIGVINGLIDGINMVLDGVKLATGGAVDLHVNHLGTIPHLAKGGLVNGPTTALIGEAGPEVVTPLKDFERMMGISGGNDRPIYADGIGLLGWMKQTASGEAKIVFNTELGKTALGAR